MVLMACNYSEDLSDPWSHNLLHHPLLSINIQESYTASEALEYHQQPSSWDSYPPPLFLFLTWSLMLHCTMLLFSWVFLIFLTFRLWFCLLVTISCSVLCEFKGHLVWFQGAQMHTLHHHRLSMVTLI